MNTSKYLKGRLPKGYKTAKFDTGISEVVEYNNLGQEPILYADFGSLIKLIEKEFNPKNGDKFRITITREE